MNLHIEARRFCYHMMKITSGQSRRSQLRRVCPHEAILWNILPEAFPIEDLFFSRRTPRTTHLTWSELKQRVQANHPVPLPSPYPRLPDMGQSGQLETGISCRHSGRSSTRWPSRTLVTDEASQVYIFAHPPMLIAISHQRSHHHRHRQTIHTTTSSLL